MGKISKSGRISQKWEDWFNSTWEHYGKVGNRKTSLEKYIKIILNSENRTLKATQIYEGIVRYKASLKKQKIVEGWAPSQKHFTTWLNQEAWKDEYQFYKEGIGRASPEKLILDFTKRKKRNGK